MPTSQRLLGLTVPVTEVLDPKLWRDRYAFGILLGEVRRTRIASRKPGDTSKALKTTIDAIPDDVIRWHLRAALSEMELKLGLPMGVQVCKADPLDDDAKKWRDYDRIVPRLPYTRCDAENWFRIDLPPSVISVERIRGYYFGTKVWEISNEKGNLDLIRVQWARQGITHILPTNLQSLLVLTGSGNYGVWSTLQMHRSPIPDFWACDYTIGPIANDGQAGQVEAVIANWVACAAGILLLDMMGMAVSKGLTSTSVSMDGVSRSISLGASAMYGINSSLERLYDEATKRIDIKALRTAKRGLRVKAYGY